MPSAGGQSPHGVPGWRRCSRHTLGLLLLDTLTTACDISVPLRKGACTRGGGGPPALLGASRCPHRSLTGQTAHEDWSVTAGGAAVPRKTNRGQESEMGQIMAYYWTQLGAAPVEVSVARVDISVSQTAA